MLEAVLILGLMAGLFGLGLGYAAARLQVEGEPLVERINEQLPQTQCAQCGYPGCRPYAEALARGEADINQCPPGGEAGVRRLAELLGRDPKPLDTRRGAAPTAKTVAFIDEARCIGCTLCLPACPVDAILGANKLMHTVLTSACTGCGLCLPPCPVDCIVLEPAPASMSDGGRPRLGGIPA